MLIALAATANVVVSLRNGRKIEVVRKQSNSMKDELVNEVRSASFAQGVKQGVKSEKDNPT